MLLKLNLEFQASLLCQVGAVWSDSTLCNLSGGSVFLDALSRVQLFAASWTAAHQAPLWDPPGKSTGACCHALLQGIFPTQELNVRLLNWQADSLPTVPPDLFMKAKPSFLSVMTLRREVPPSSCQSFLKELLDKRGAYICLEGISSSWAPGTTFVLRIQQSTKGEIAKPSKTKLLHVTASDSD